MEAAVQAAWFSETWLVAWDIPVPIGDARADFPRGRTTRGLSLIATGHSGADTFMAAYAYQYYRLYRLTGEPNFLAVSRSLLYNTKQITDWDGTLGYAHRALQTEAVSLSLLRGHSVRLWLPWLTVGQIEPLVRLQDAYGNMDIDAIEVSRRKSQ